MSECVRRLANTCAFTSLQNKINHLNDNYVFNSCTKNFSRLCDLSEKLARMQDKLLNAMSVTASEGGICCDLEVFKNRLSSMGSILPVDDSIEKEREIIQLKLIHSENIVKLQSELDFAEKQLSLIRQELRIAQDEAARYKVRLDLLGNYEREVNRLRSEVRNLRSEKECLEIRVGRCRIRSCSPPRRDRGRAPCRYTPPPRSCSPVFVPLSPRCTSPTRAEFTNSIRHSRLVARFNDLYTIDRLDMQDRLRRFVCDDDMVKRIIFIAVCESFQVAKMAYRSFRLRARRTLSPCHLGPCTLEEAVNDYIVRNLDLYDVDKSVDDVIRAMNVNPKISFPPECEFILLSAFIREACRIAYEMQALSPVLDIPVATDGELFCDTKYRRNYDSEYSAPLISFHIWPVLMEGCRVHTKGECITRHGASRERSRSSTPRSCTY